MNKTPRSQIFSLLLEVIYIKVTDYVSTLHVGEAMNISVALRSLDEKDCKMGVLYSKYFKHTTLLKNIIFNLFFFFR